jgi:hypothetical protein
MYRSASLGFRRHRGLTQRLPLGRAALENPLDVRPKADVEHPIGFVQNHDLDLGKVDGPASQVIEHAARRANDDLRSLAQLFDLLPDRLAAIDGGAMNPPPFGFTSSFTWTAGSRVAQDPGLRMMDVVPTAAVRNRNPNDVAFAKRLADHVNFFERKWNQARLNLRGILIAGLVERVEHDVREAEAGEGGLRGWTVLQNGQPLLLAGRELTTIYLLWSSC